MAEASGAAAGSEAIAGTRKVAALLLVMGKPLADRVLKHFSETEIRRVVDATARLGAVPREAVNAFVAEISEAFSKGADIRGTLDDIETMLSGIVPPEQLASLMAGLRAESQRSVWLQLPDLPEATLLQFLLKEHPQVVAYILAKAGSGTSAAVLRQVPSALRSELIRRILAMRSLTDQAQALIEQCLHDELLTKVSKNTGPAVHARIADIINKMERQQMEEVLGDLEQKRPKDAKLVKGLLFTFDDIVRLTPADRVKLFDGVPAERTILALQGASPTLRETVLSAVSSRSRRMIEQEVASGASVPARDVIRARRAIADLALELAERGQIDIGQQDEALG